MQMWLWSLQHLLQSHRCRWRKLYQTAAQGVTFPLADALCWLLSAPLQISICSNLKRSPANPTVAESLPGLLAFLTDLCHVQSARAAGEVGRVCAECVRLQPPSRLGHRGLLHLLQAGDLDAMESLIPGIASLARGYTDVVEQDGAHPPKAGPCVRFDGLDQFSRYVLAWMVASPARSSPKTAPPKPSPKS